jgi:hypothetical protein
MRPLEAELPSSTNPGAVKIMFQVTQIVRFLPERGLVGAGWDRTLQWAHAEV